MTDRDAGAIHTYPFSHRGSGGASERERTPGLADFGLSNGFATDPYATLGVQSSASLATIKSAWKVAALKYHPDKCGDDGTRFRAVQAAWEVLREKGARPPMKGAKGSQFNATRARHAKDSELRAAAQTADFDAKARAFVARQQAKKREYEATEEGQTKSPADAMKARNQARLEARYKQMMDQREAHQRNRSNSAKHDAQIVSQKPHENQFRTA